MQSLKRFAVPACARRLRLARYAFSTAVLLVALGAPAAGANTTVATGACTGYWTAKLYTPTITQTSPVTTRYTGAFDGGGSLTCTSLSTSSWHLDIWGTYTSNFQSVVPSLPTSDECHKYFAWPNEVLVGQGRLTSTSGQSRVVGLGDLEIVDDGVETTLYATGADDNGPLTITGGGSSVSDWCPQTYVGSNGAFTIT